jgi:hypothetical protein
MADRDKLPKKRRPGAKTVHKKEVVDMRHTLAETDRPDTPALEGGPPLPEELTGRASGTGEDLTALFDNESKEHMTDGFRGGSDDDE